jgi:hypothetical protein
MAWERRPGRTAYYTRAERLPGGGFRRTYLGSGPAAEAAAASDQASRQARAAQRLRVAAEKQQLADLAVPLVELNGLAELLARAALLVAGYHQHSRGAWRRKKQ